MHTPIAIVHNSAYFSTCNTNAMQNIQLVERKRKSERLAKDEHKAFVKLYHSYPTKIDAAIYFELSRQVLDMVVVRGSGSPDTVRAIRKKLNAAQI